MACLSPVTTSDGRWDRDGPVPTHPEPPARDVYDIPEDYCDYIAFKRDGVDHLSGQRAFTDKLRQLTSYPRRAAR
jgi:hypothetical protein